MNNYHIRVLAALIITLLGATGLLFESTHAASGQPEEIKGNEPEPTPIPFGQIEDEDGIPEGYMIIEGDIIVPVGFSTQGVEAVWATNFWPSTVPYEFDANVTAINQQRAIDAMAEWEAVANVNFVPRANEANYIHIQNSTKNSSQIGMVGGKQVVNIISWNSRFIIVHELAHVLGMWHEQSRVDRDSYVNIIWACIPADKENNFERHDESDVYPKGEYAPFGLTGDEIYDFDSVMHYGQTDFYEASEPGCTGSITIDVLSAYETWQTGIGQRDHLSDLDQLTMSFLYSESNWRFVDWSNSGGVQNGAFLEPQLTITNGVNSTPSGGTLWVQPGSYNETGTFNTPMTIRAPLGSVTIGK